MKNLLILCLLAVPGIASAQVSQNPRPTAASRRYHEFRMRITEPPFALSKIKALVKRVEKLSTEDQRLPAKKFNAMTVEERFTYCMLHGEDFSQICDMMPTIAGEDKKIFGETLDGWQDHVWSDQQTTFLQKNRARVIQLLRATIQRRHEVGMNLKHAITELKANELIPDIIAVYNRDHKDHDILTVLMLLMKEGHYKPFLASATYLKLYGPNADFTAYIVANPANQKLTLSRATDFYKSWKG